MWPNFSYRGVRSVQLLLLLLLLMVFSSENFGFSPPYAGIAGIGLETRTIFRLYLNKTNTYTADLRFRIIRKYRCFFRKKIDTYRSESKHFVQGDTHISVREEKI